MSKLRESLSIFSRAGSDMMNDRVPMMGAAVAYYTIFSIAPLLVIALGIVGLVFGQKGGKEVFQAIQGLVGPNGATAIEAMVRASSQEPRGGLLAAILGFVVLIVGASSVFAQMQDSLDIIMKVAPKPSASWWALIRQRLLSFGMIVIIAFLLLVSLLISAGLAAVWKGLGPYLPGSETLWHGVNFAVSLAVITFLFALMLKVLPDVRLSWWDVVLGGLITAVLFTIGKSLIGLYLGKSTVASTYGAAGSLVIVLIWVYYSSQIVLLGAEITHAYVTRGGRSVTPKSIARPAATPISLPAGTEDGGRKPGPEPAGSTRQRR